MAENKDFAIDDIIDGMIDDVEIAEPAITEPQTSFEVEDYAFEPSEPALGSQIEGDNQDIIEEIEEKTGHKLSPDDPALAFLEITKVAGERFAHQMQDQLTRLLNEEKAERQLLIQEASDLKSEINALKSEIQQLTKDSDDGEPSVIKSLRTTAAYIYSEIKRIGG